MPAAIARDYGQLVDEHAAAERLGLAVATLRRWRWSKSGLPWVKCGAAVRYSVNDLNEFVAANRQEPVA
jgi:hypothetical protein